VQGKVGRREDNNRWTFEVMISLLGVPGDPIIMSFHDETFDTEAEALRALRERAEHILTIACEAIGLGTPDSTIDLLTNEERPLGGKDVH